MPRRTLATVLNVLVSTTNTLEPRPFGESNHVRASSVRAERNMVRKIPVELVPVGKGIVRVRISDKGNCADDGSSGGVDDVHFGPAVGGVRDVGASSIRIDRESPWPVTEVDRGVCRLKVRGVERQQCVFIAIQQGNLLPSEVIAASANAQMPLLAPMVLVTAFTVGLDGLISTTATPPYWVSGAYKRPLLGLTASSPGHGA